MAHKFYIGLLTITASLVLLGACVTSEQAIDSKSVVLDEDAQRKQRIDSAQQVKMGTPVEKSTINKPNTTNSVKSKRNG